MVKGIRKKMGPSEVASFRFIRFPSGAITPWKVYRVAEHLVHYIL